MTMNLYDRIPNNVNLSEDKKLQRALEKWLPNYIDWWREMGPDGFQEKDVWLRTAVDVGSEGWAHFDYVKMPNYRWGIFLEHPQPDAKVGFGDNYGRPAYQEVPGEFRNALRRIIVTQGDTEPASVEQPVTTTRQDVSIALRPAQSLSSKCRRRSTSLGDGLFTTWLLRS